MTTHSSYLTMVEVLASRARRTPDRMATTFSSDGEPAEASHHYQSAIDGTRPPLPASPMQEPDLDRWPRGALTPARTDELLRYWHAALQGVSPTLELPTDRPRPQRQRFAARRVPVQLSGELVERVHALARAEGTTPSAILLTAVAVLLARHADQWDLVIGVPAAHRERPEVDPLIGFFAQAVPVRADLSGRPGFRAAVARVHGSLLGALDHTELPFEQLVDSLGLEHDPGRQPLCQVMCSLRAAPGEPPRLPGLAPAAIDRAAAVSRFDLTFELEPDVGPRADAGGAPGPLAGHIEYSTDLFEEITIRRLFDRFTCLLDEAVRQPDTEVALLPLLPAEELRRLEAFHGAPPALSPRCLHEPVRERMRAAPDRIALRAGARSLTYRELAVASDRLARRLQVRSVGPEVTVGVWADHGIEAVVAVLGILQAGGAAVPLSVRDPLERVARSAESARLAAIVAPAGDPRLEALAALVPVVPLDDGEGSAVAPALSAVGPDHLAYVLFASGSAERPRGVAVTHGAAASTLSGMQERLGIGADDVVVTVASLASDLALLDLFLTLWAGARLVIAAPEVAAEGARLAALLDESGATRMLATPATWALLLDAGWRPRSPFRVWTGGEPLTRALADQLGELVWSCYGPTEAALCAAVDRAWPGEPISIGRPLANARMYILDPHGRPAPIGVAGELHIGGHGLARGYVGEPEQTTAAFPPDRLADAPAARCFRTGERARFLSDGRIELLRRMDPQRTTQARRDTPRREDEDRPCTHAPSRFELR
jgi:surfactin family lipopeptide synthetase A